MRKPNLLALVKQSIADKEMCLIAGGSYKTCECACIYENKGGASTADNASANYEEGIRSTDGCNRIKKTEDGWEVIVQIHE